VEQVLCKRFTAHISRGLPPRMATAFSPPKRTDRPPAMTTPTTEPEIGFDSELELTGKSTHGEIHCNI
jgi:hypothetical protein